MLATYMFSEGHVYLDCPSDMGRFQVTLRVNHRSQGYFSEQLAWIEYSLTNEGEEALQFDLGRNQWGDPKDWEPATIHNHYWSPKAWEPLGIPGSWGPPGALSPWQLQEASRPLGPPAVVVDGCWFPKGYEVRSLSGLLLVLWLDLGLPFGT